MLRATRLPSPQWPVPLLTAAFAVAAAGGLWSSLQQRAATTRFQAGLVFAADACHLSPGVAQSFGGPFTAAECATVERLARREVASAFEGLRLDVTADPAAFWTVHVRSFVPSRTRTVGAAGASLAFGPLGGRGVVGFTPLTAHALRHAPPETSRADLVAAIGRGVGRSVVHEFTHQIAGGAIDSSDASSYEYRSVDRHAQFFGALRWGIAGERLRARLGH